jgi:Tol biopolymer transport system component
VERSETGPDTIILISAQSGEKRVLGSLPVRFGNSDPAFSPDGRALAFVHKTNVLTGEIYLQSLDPDATPRGEPRRLTTDNRDIDGLAWTPDGDGIVFSSHRDGNFGLWRIAASGGAPQKLPVGGENALYPTVSRTGSRLAYAHWVSDVNLWRVR